MLITILHMQLFVNICSPCVVIPLQFDFAAYIHDPTALKVFEIEKKSIDDRHDAEIDSVSQAIPAPKERQIGADNLFVGGIVS